MKTRNYLWAVLAAATLSLVACGGEENENTEPQPQEKTAKLEISILGTSNVNTKSTGTLPTTDESKIKRIAVAIFNSDNTVNTISEFTTTTPSISINCTPGVGCSGVAVANAPANAFAGVTTKPTFLAKTVTLGQTAAELPMSGDIEDRTTSAKTFTLTAGATTNVKVDLDRMVARVSISSIKTDFDPAGQYSKATFTAKQIFMHNANTTSNVDPGTLTTTVPKTGWDDASVTATYVATLKDDVGTGGVAITGTAYTTPYWFYTFPSSKTTSTRLVIRGDFDPDGTGSVASSDVYYPVVVNLDQTGTSINSGAKDGTIARNTTYAITATIKGKGAPNPNTNMNPATLDLTVTVAAWALNITQDVDFN